MTVRINLSHHYGDDALKDVLVVVEGEDYVEDATGPGSAAEKIRTYFDKLHDRTGCVDLISHSLDGVLQVAFWDTSSEGKASLLYDALGSVGDRIAEIRLLGCNTAYTEAGKAAMRMLAGVFDGVAILGSPVPLAANSFNASGLTAPGDLKGVGEIDSVRISIHAPDTLVESSLKAFPLYHTGDTGDVLDRLHRETTAEALLDLIRTPPWLRWPVRLAHGEKQFRALVNLCVPTMRQAPGLLALPEREVLVRVSPVGLPARYRRLTLLLGSDFMRIYPEDHRRDGVILQLPNGNQGVLDAWWNQLHPFDAPLSHLDAPP